MSIPVATRSGGINLTIAATSLGFVLEQLDVSVLNVALARIGTAVGIGVTGLQWVVDAYTIAFASLLLASGALGDRIGARRAYIGGFALFVLASLGCGLAPGAAVLITARAVQGMGAALLVPCSLTLLTHACGNDAAARGRAISLWTAAASVALSAGPVLGGVLVDTRGGAASSSSTCRSACSASGSPIASWPRRRRRVAASTRRDRSSHCGPCSA